MWMVVEKPISAEEEADRASRCLVEVEDEVAGLLACGIEARWWGMSGVAPVVWLRPCSTRLKLEVVDNDLDKADEGEVDDKARDEAGQERGDRPQCVGVGGREAE